MEDILSTLPILPFAFWVALLATVFFGYKAWQLRESSVGIPMMMVLATVGTWYFGDALYNNYSEYCAEFTGDPLSTAWWEVLVFVCTFGIVAPKVHQSINRNLVGRQSSLLSFIRHGGLGASEYQWQIDKIC